MTVSPYQFCILLKIGENAEKEKGADEGTGNNELYEDGESGGDVSDNESDVDSNEEKPVRSDSEEEEEEEEEELNEDSDQELKRKEEAFKAKKLKQLSDVKEGKTLFIRKISFDTSEESLHELFEQFGELDYCKMLEDKRTGHSRGMAFVKYKTVESAEKCLMEANKDGPGKNVM